MLICNSLAFDAVLAPFTIRQMRDVVSIDLSLAGLDRLFDLSCLLGLFFLLLVTDLRAQLITSVLLVDPRICLLRLVPVLILRTYGLMRVVTAFYGNNVACLVKS